MVKDKKMHMEDFNPTEQMMKERMAIIDAMISTGGFCKDYWCENDMPTYYDAETLSPEHWDELMEHANYILRRY